MQTDRTAGARAGLGGCAGSVGHEQCESTWAEQ